MGEDPETTKKEKMTDKNLNPDRPISVPADDCPKFEEAREFGIDISMLVDNLNRTVEERIRRHQIAANLAKELRNAKLL